jgi:hypothetical protein
MQERGHQDAIDNDTAVYFLVTSFGEVVYTNISVKGGEGNG